ncbi:MAG TPA: glycosyltransferase [Candidatus Limnocylindria bacterium]|nr:glycosyltransferase [Candidatus Limnocylindria bacterium]
MAGLAPGGRSPPPRVLDYTPGWYRKIYVKGYLKLIEHAPEVYAMMFKKTDNVKRIQELMKFRRRSSRIMATKFVKELVAFQPEMVLAPHYLPLEIIGGVMGKRRSRLKKNPFVACIVTDFEAHALWMEPCVNLYCVAAPATKARMVARGVGDENVVVTGIPIAAKFSSRVDANAIRAQFVFERDVPTLLVLGGGFGMGLVREILAELDKIQRVLQIIVVCGKNEKLRQQIASESQRHRTAVLGFATNMHELMSASDLILTKPGGLTTSEALAMGKPILILNPIPGQEAANSDFLLEEGTAVKVNCIEDLPFKITNLLDSKKLLQMARAAQALGKPRAATAICEAALAASSGGTRSANPSLTKTRSGTRGTRPSKPAAFA